MDEGRHSFITRDKFRHLHMSKTTKIPPTSDLGTALREFLAEAEAVRSDEKSIYLRPMVHEDVSKHATAILTRLKAGTMPCDAP